MLQLFIIIIYSSVGIQSLSPSQIRRLKKGHNVSVKLGTAHNIHLSPEQIKKLHAAAKKGKASHRAHPRTAAAAAYGRPHRSLLLLLICLFQRKYSQ